MIKYIEFPGLGLSFEINRVAFNLLGRPIYWYAIIIATGFLLAVFYGMSRSREFNTNDDELIEMLMFAVPLSIVFARVYYVVFNIEPYIEDPISVLYIWEGGIAIYGAVIGAIIGAILYCKIKKTSTVKFLDIGALGLMIGQSIGRWGNFVNAEAYGEVTTLPWRMEIYDAAAHARICVHPTFLYESLWNALGFLILHFYSKRRKFNGEIFVLYLIWYGFGRAVIEGLRTDSLYLFNTGIRISQALGIITALSGIVYLILRHNKLKTEEKNNECSDN